jgi:hypothetical protein
MSIYTDEGYTSRRDYLENLADDLGLDRAEELERKAAQK